MSVSTVCHIVTGQGRSSLGDSFVLADWIVGVFGSSGLIDRPHGCLYMWTIPLSGCIDICSSYIPFYSQA